MRVTQALSNLIANAIKFTDQGWVRLVVSRLGGELRIEVQDTGLGVSASAGDSVFAPFYRFKDQEGARGGAGLGLAISKELADRMGGTLELKHSSSGGSSFELRLPLGETLNVSSAGASRSTKQSQAGTTVSGSERNGNKRVLVVEDNQLNADILGHFLKDYGVAHDHVDNGRAAVDMYRDDKYDLVLMDVMLPEMNGYEATEKILAKSKRKPTVPIVGVTAKVFRRDQMRCIEAGMVEVVHKPVDFKQLRKVLDNRLCADRGGRSRLSQITSSFEEGLEVASLSHEGDVKVEKLASSAGRDCMDAGTLEAYIDRMKTPDTSRVEIVNTALAIVDAEVKSLVESIGAGDRKEIGMRAHSLKGALALLGARNILDLAKGLELIASDGRSPLKAEHWKSMVEGAYAEFRGQLEAYMDTTVVE
jgi:CheY-like chemotaxis protein